MNSAGVVLWMINGCEHHGCSAGRGVHRRALPYSASVTDVAALFPCKEGSLPRQRRSTSQECREFRTHGTDMQICTDMVVFPQCAPSRWGLKRDSFSRNESACSLWFTGSSLPSAKEFGFCLDYSSCWRVVQGSDLIRAAEDCHCKWWW